MNTQDNVKKPISHELIFKIMFWITLIVSSVFLIKNILLFNLGGLIATGSCMAVFLISILVMKKMNVDNLVKEFIVSIYLILIAFTISLFSGASYSDDFPLFLAIIGMTGMYLEPKFTRVQIIVIDIILVLMYIIHPEKAGGLEQYILCTVMFTLAAILFYITIRRGRAFIEISTIQAQEAKDLVSSIRQMGDIIQQDFDSSSHEIAESTNGLRSVSDNITDEANEVSESCQSVHDKIHITEQQISTLNNRVKMFEQALSENQGNMEAMKSQLRSASDIIAQSDSVFHSMKKHMNEVAEIAQKLGDISFKTTLLSLNASVEAANAGSAGAGFAVVASEMKELSENSDTFAVQVSEVVSELLNQVEQTSLQFADSINAVKRSESQMNELQESFSRLTEQFTYLYDNIDNQNGNISQVDDLFSELEHKVTEMRDNSEKNRSAVMDIAKAMDNYRVNISKVIENTRV